MASLAGTTEKERRQAEENRRLAWRRELNLDQQITLKELEGFGWELAFIRHPMFQPSVCVVRDPTNKFFSVLQDDGTLVDNHDLQIRPNR